MKNQITVRGLDEETGRRLRELSRRLHVSLNRAALILLRKGAGLADDDGPEVVGDSLDAFIGSWSREQEAEFLESIRETRQIDRDLWR